MAYSRENRRTGDNLRHPLLDLQQGEESSQFKKKNPARRNISLRQVGEALFMLVGLAILIVWTLILIASAILSPPSVTMHPISFSFSNFTANLEAEMVFGCENCAYEESKTRVYYDFIRARIFYRQEGESELSRTSAEPFNMGYNEHNKIYLRFGNTEGKDKQNQSIVKGEEVDHEIGKKVEGGIVTNLTLKLHSRVDYIVWGKFWVPDVWNKANAYCWDLVVGVMPDTGSGRLILTATKECKDSY